MQESPQATPPPPTQPAQPVAVPEATPAPQPAATPDAAVEATPAADTGFVVSNDLYKKTFSEIEELVARLNEIIKNLDYDSWMGYLSPEYVTQVEDPGFLNQASQSAILRKYGIVLHSLKDYFAYVVVPSRSQAQVSDIVFLDESHVQAWTNVNGVRVILYRLEKAGSRWLIAPEPPDTAR